jgi:hypothetical protein
MFLELFSKIFCHFKQTTLQKIKNGDAGVEWGIPRHILYTRSNGKKPQVFYICSNNLCKGIHFAPILMYM